MIKKAPAGIMVAKAIVFLPNHPCPGWYRNVFYGKYIRSFPFAAVIGRTLEKAGTAILGFKGQIIEQVSHDLANCLPEEVVSLRGAPSDLYQNFSIGFLLRLKQSGAIGLPLIKDYISDGGSYFKLSQVWKPYFPSIGKNSRLPAFLTNKKKGASRFQLVTNKKSNCFSDWLQQCFGSVYHDVGLHSIDVYNLLIKILEKKKCFFLMKGT